MVKRKKAKAKPRKATRKPVRRKTTKKKTARRKTAKKKAVRRKTTRKKTVRRKTARRKAARKTPTEVVDTPLEIAKKNRAALWAVYRDLQKKADMAWSKLRTDVQRKASSEVLLEDRNNLMLLLGECNYLAGECMRMGKF